MFKKFLTSLNNLFNFVLSATSQEKYIPSCRLIEIKQTDGKDNYVVTVQIINKNLVIQAKPEEILADDNLVNQFSPCDIRTLTYLGYLGINSPKYKILAQKLSENSKLSIFALKKKDENEIIVKSSHEIFKEKEILQNLGALDAHLIGYTAASESFQFEKIQKQNLLNELQQSQND